jgi:hypothetical protein
MKNKKYPVHIVGTVQNPIKEIVKTDTKWILLTHKYMTAYFPVLVQAFQ